MIVGLLVSAVLAGISGLASLFPSISFPSFAGDAGWLSVLSNANRAFPLAALLGGLALVMAVRLAMAGWNFVVFVYHQFWGSN